MAGAAGLRAARKSRRVLRVHGDLGGRWASARVLTKFLPWMSAASIPGQEQRRGRSQLHVQNYPGRSRDRGRARRGRIPQGPGAHANFSASRSFACALCTGKERSRTAAGNLNASWCVRLRCYQLLVGAGAGGSPTELGSIEPCAVAAVSQSSKAAQKFRSVCVSTEALCSSQPPGKTTTLALFGLDQSHFLAAAFQKT